MRGGEWIGGMMGEAIEREDVGLVHTWTNYLGGS